LRRAHIQHDAIEIEEHPFAEIDVGIVIAGERRLQKDGIATRAEQLAQDAPFLEFRSRVPFNACAATWIAGLTSL
jgi:hypothetical protein